MLAMTLNPKWQLRAQQGIDAQLGGSRLPEVGDRDELPFLDCILQESFR